MTEEESIETFKNWLEYNKKHKNILREADKIIAVQETILNLIQKLQEENKKKDKIIDLMADKIASDNRSINEEYAVDEKMMDTKYIKQYFKNKAIQEE